MATVIRRGGGRIGFELSLERSDRDLRPVSTCNKSRDRTRASSSGQLSKRRDELRLRVLFVARSLLLTPYNGRDGVSQLGSLPLAATGAGSLGAYPIGGRLGHV